MAVLFFSVFFSQFFIATLYLQDVLGCSALRTGLGLPPFGIAVGAALGLATNLIPHVGFRPVLVARLVLSVAGALLLTRVTADGSYPRQRRGAPRDRGRRRPRVRPPAGVQQIGGAVGLAVLVTLALRVAEDDVAIGTGLVTDGYALALRVGTGVLVAATVLAAALLRRGVGRGEQPAALAL